ncbi:hypothetical protein E6P09_09470 [Haloferax mediterranei ATCC 33500]|uniref:Uncharacterized protein n=1 Tax=Haloferax mediterranei (strain ATCC 33500 / DSM 1411 / JCM 8866 / NBRC 14739 / NCIMB 2177 / R-4) TaxID=523841 RepID=I3R445_HALMT|nr:hypothetical protein [Haloferax mediterranei]AFK19005.1 hypothetical protein HFX_1293 [Haloferax mediterranei ATCC 33500]AHZ21639.1 hypothetical protein BM92_02735 [Haloferax mediterranei ATCC 33500]EMA03555.1 hypothetical protein C439_04050 [Haloferax mediterranei ATCC 33500]MDX5989097.1 hypothetical protein [Haloferax mediterranei ATCC 33500]QCQ75483.1 hypothetical protein E6P09_09470 [Haloferax mediterranei ATCC 33500]
MVKIHKHTANLIESKRRAVHQWAENLLVYAVIMFLFYGVLILSVVGFLAVVFAYIVSDDDVVEEMMG